MPIPTKTNRHHNPFSFIFMTSIFGSHALKELGMEKKNQPQYKENEHHEAVTPVKCFGRIIKTRKEANRLVANAATAAAFFGAMSALIVLFTHSGTFFDTLILFILTFFIQKKKSRAASVILFCEGILGIVYALSFDTHTILAPTILTWFAWQGMQGTYALKAFALAHENASTSPPPPPSQAASDPIRR